jgi:hypothetical protein
MLTQYFKYMVATGPINCTSNSSRPHSGTPRQVLCAVQATYHVCLIAVCAGICRATEQQHQARHLLQLLQRSYGQLTAAAADRASDWEQQRSGAEPSSHEQQIACPPARAVPTPVRARCHAANPPESLPLTSAESPPGIQTMHRHCGLQQQQWVRRSSSAGDG